MPYLIGVRNIAALDTKLKNPIFSFVLTRCAGSQNSNSYNYSNHTRAPRPPTTNSTQHTHCRNPHLTADHNNEPQQRKTAKIVFCPKSPKPHQTQPNRLSTVCPPRAKCHQILPLPPPLLLPPQRNPDLLPPPAHNNSINNSNNNIL